MKGLSALMSRHGDTMAKLADVLDVNINTVWRWRVGQNAPGIDIQRAICERYGCSMDELLNGPSPEGYRVTLSFVKNIEEAQDEMMINGCGAVTLADDGTVLASHMGKLFSREDKAAILAAIDAKLDEALETVNRRAEKTRAAEEKGAMNNAGE